MPEEIEDIIRIAAVVLFIVVPVLARLFRRPAPAMPVGELDDDETEMNEEIERFLREASDPQHQPRPAAEHAPEPVLAEIVAPRRLSDSGSRHLETSIGAGEERFGQHTSVFGDEVSQADEAMEGHIHEAFDHKLGGLADTSVGADVPDADPDADPYDEAGSTADEKQSLAAELAATFREPQGMRQAIILSEILTRPEHRWSRGR
jgi:hypothetical protein